VDLPERVLAVPVALRQRAFPDAPQVRPLAGDPGNVKSFAALPHPRIESKARA
jgi:hypothetical protein